MGSLHEPNFKSFCCNLESEITLEPTPGGLFGLAVGMLEKSARRAAVNDSVKFFSDLEIEASESGKSATGINSFNLAQTDSRGTICSLKESA